MEWMTFADPDQAFPCATDQSPSAQALLEIFGTGWIESAPAREERGYQQLVTPDYYNQSSY